MALYYQQETTIMISYWNRSVGDIN
jgi:hypothetical protein